MTAIASALAALTASGSDPETLASAIQGAAFLDATPGNARQQLRGERGGRRREERREERVDRPRPRARRLCAALPLTARSLSPPPLLPFSRPRPPPEDPGGRGGQCGRRGGPAGGRAVAFCQGGERRWGRGEVFFLFFFGRGHPFARSPLARALALTVAPPLSSHTIPPTLRPLPPPTRAWPGGRCPSRAGRRSSRTSFTPSTR